MKALSVRQPWAWLIAHGYKPIENRRNWLMSSFRGELAIHASQSVSRAEHEDCVDFLISCGLPGEVPPYQHYPLGSIVCVVNVADCIAARQVGESYADTLQRCPAHAQPWWDQDQSGLLLDSVRRLKTAVRCKGMLGIWRVPSDVERQVREQLRPVEREPAKPITGHAPEDGRTWVLDGSPIDGRRP